jgi:tRNA-2-methylthio-N6-dimethylallyladenosine synthase
MKKEKKVYVLTGCMAVRHNRCEGGVNEKYVTKLKNKFPWITHVVDIRDIQKLPKILGIKERVNVEHKNYLNIPASSKDSIVTNIPISTGCNFFCSYCIVPFARGELLNRDYADIISEVSHSIKNGAKLICLVAQNVNSWVGFKNGERVDFAKLLEDVAAIEGDFWITFVSSNPMDFSKRMVKAMAENEKIMRWLNIAVQSGSNEVLKKMNRRYTREEFEGLIKMIKKEIPDIRLTTDIIVGFPTETREDFEKSLDLIKGMEFQMAYVGKYSPRELTLSAKLEDDVSLKEKKRREDILKDEVNKMRGEFHKKFVGKRMKVLVLSEKKALSYYNHEIVFEKPLSKNEKGCFVNALITKSNLAGLVAKV